MFKFQSPPKYSPFDAKHLLGHFFPLLKTVFSTAQNSRFCCHLVLLLFFVPLFHISKMFPFEDFFSPRETKRSLRVRSGEWGEWGFGGPAILAKKCWTQQGVGRWACKSPMMRWENKLKESLEKFTEAKCSLSQQHQLVYWCRWVPRTLT